MYSVLRRWKWPVIILITLIGMLVSSLYYVQIKQWESRFRANDIREYGQTHMGDIINHLSDMEDGLHDLAGYIATTPNIRPDRLRHQFALIADHHPSLNHRIYGFLGLADRVNEPPQSAERLSRLQTARWDAPVMLHDGPSNRYSFNDIMSLPRLDQVRDSVIFANTARLFPMPPKVQNSEKIGHQYIYVMPVMDNGRAYGVLISLLSIPPAIIDDGAANGSQYDGQHDSQYDYQIVDTSSRQTRRLVKSFSHPEPPKAWLSRLFMVEQANFSDTFGFADRLLKVEFRPAAAMPFHSQSRLALLALVSILSMTGFTGWYVHQTSHQQDQLRHAKETAEQATKIQKDFLSMMSHELRTPLNGILGMAQLALRDGGMDTAAKDRIEMIQKSGQGLLQILNDLLDFSKIEAGKMELEVISFMPEMVIRDAIDLFSPLAKRKDIRLTHDVQADLPYRFYGDPTRLRQILNNLISNAIKFTDDGHITIGFSGHELDSDHWQVEFHVADTGIGIEPEVKQAIFDRFQQADQSTSRRFGGTGLGLSICRHLAQMMGGDISVESELSTGSKFTVTMSLKIDDTHQKQLAEHRLKLSKMGVAIWDQNDERRDKITDILTSYDVDLSIFKSLADALEGLQKLEDEGRPAKVSMIGKIKEDLARATDAINKLNLKQPANLMLHDDDHDYSDAQLADMGFKATVTTPQVTPNRLVSSISQARDLTDEEFISDGRKKSLREIKSQDQRAPTSLHILVVEDSFVNQEVCKQILSTQGWHVITATSGMDALHTLNEYPADIIIMDCQMPEMDGYTATRRIRQMEIEQDLDARPILALTANVSADAKDACIEAGMDDYLAKPIDPNDLIDMVMRHVTPDSREQDEIDEDTTDQKKREFETVLDTDRYETLSKTIGYEKIDYFIKRFIGDMRTHTGGVLSGMDDKNWELVERSAHTLKSSAAQIGAMRLSATCQQIETAAEQQDEDKISPLTSQLKRDIQASLTQLRQYHDFIDV